MGEGREGFLESLSPPAYLSAHLNFSRSTW